MLCLLIFLLNKNCRLENVNHVSPPMLITNAWDCGIFGWIYPTYGHNVENTVKSADGGSKP